MLPGLTREAEEQKLQEIIGIAQQNLERARADIRKVNEDLEDLLDVYEAQDKEGLALWNNATARLKENEYDLVRYEKARRKPYFGRIDFKDPNVKGDESYYIGRVGIAKNNSEPVVLDWRAPIASVYYESGLGPCQYTVSSEGTFTIDLKRKRTYEIGLWRTPDNQILFFLNRCNDLTEHRLLVFRQILCQKFIICHHIGIKKIFQMIIFNLIRAPYFLYFIQLQR